MKRKMIECSGKRHLLDASVWSCSPSCNQTLCLVNVTASPDYDHITLFKGEASAKLTAITLLTLYNF